MEEFIPKIFIVFIIVFIFGIIVGLLLTDVAMPEMNGGELAERVSEIIPSASILFMSGYAPETFTRHEGINPMNNLLRKPFTASELVERVSNTLRSSVHFK